jgi:hypothetical protein
MRCANPACSAEELYLRSGGIYHVDFPDAAGDAGEGRIMQRRVIWLCDTCTGMFAVETWRPPGEQMRRSGSAPMRFPGARGSRGETESWS